jgi:hypothetical protein
MHTLPNAAEEVRARSLIRTSGRRLLAALEPLRTWD